MNHTPSYLPDPADGSTAEVVDHVLGNRFRILGYPMSSPRPSRPADLLVAGKKQWNPWAR